VLNKIVAFANQKGGVGKTTSSVNFSAALVALHYRVLLVDLDPQGNATVGSGVNKETITAGVNEVLQEQIEIEKAIIHKTEAGYALLPANGDLTVAEVALLRKPSQESNLKKALNSVRENYDIIVIDCPPSLNMLTLNAFVATDSVIIPLQCEFYALEGLSALMNTIDQVQRTLNPSLVIEGIVRTMYDPRNRLSTEISAQLIVHFGTKIYQTVIPRNIRLAEAPSHGVSIFLYDRNSRGADAYMALAREFLKYHKKMPLLEAVDAVGLIEN
jgi:chromosome partitioning protein